MSISLSSHVLDTTLGKPAANMKLALTTLDGQVIVTQTDSDGRCNQWQDYTFFYQRLFTDPSQQCILSLRRCAF
jgi:5-hydroxyisourate hydrolase-like protein (transthyretin family)